MKKKFFVLFILVVILGGGFFTYEFLSGNDAQKPKSTAISYEGKDCGSAISTKGNNRDTIDRNCFIEAYKTCSSAKISREVVDPDNHIITTIIYVDAVKKDNNCQVSIHTENKYKIPENEIDYCYKVTLGGADNLNNDLLKLDNCTNKKQLYF